MLLGIQPFRRGGPAVDPGNPGPAIQITNQEVRRPAAPEISPAGSPIEAEANGQLSKQLMGDLRSRIRVRFLDHVPEHYLSRATATQAIYCQGFAVAF